MDYRYTRGVLLSVFIHRIIDDKFVYSYDAFGTYKVDCIVDVCIFV